MPELLKKNEDGISILFYLQKIYPGIPFLLVLPLYGVDCSLQFYETEYPLTVTYNGFIEALSHVSSNFLHLETMVREFLPGSAHLLLEFS